MKLRKYKEEDAKYILSWINNEREFRMWSADRYDKYPITENDINTNYKECSRLEKFLPMTLLDDNNNIIGHLILRNPREDISIIRLGFIIVDARIRGKGYGKLLIQTAIEYAKNKLNAKEINLGVFTNNTNAYNCYKSCGFKEIKIEKNSLKFKNESWDCAEMILGR